jgi:hypothetical protein
MTTRMWILPLAALGLVLCGGDTPAGKQPGSKVPEKLLQTQLDCARKTYQEFWKSQEFRSADTAYLWSCRWLAAQRQLTENKKELKTAVDSHLARMQELQGRYDQLFQQKLVGLEQVYAVSFYLAEAEIWVAQAKE